MRHLKKGKRGVGLDVHSVQGVSAVSDCTKRTLRLKRKNSSEEHFWEGQ